MSSTIIARPERREREICLVEGTNIAGTRHVAGVRELAEGFERGMRFSFERDPRNMFDEWAVRVLGSNGERLGYVSCDCNEVVARLLDGGKRVFGRFEGVRQVGSWTRIEMAVYLDD